MQTKIWVIARLSKTVEIGEDDDDFEQITDEIVHDVKLILGDYYDVKVWFDNSEEDLNP